MLHPPFRLDDRTRFPMYWVDGLNAYIHWLPVTKVQFEYFLCEINDSQFDEAWYDDILSLNQRVAPGSVRPNNYWHAFITGVLPNEAQRYARWCGPNYTLPTLEEWMLAYRTLKQQPTQDINAILGLAKLNERARTLVQQLDHAPQSALKNLGYPRTRSEQMLLRLGVMEWVECRNYSSRWGGMGETYADFHSALFSPESGQPRLPKDPETDRIPYYGFRLLWREG